jgi:cell division septation protein DedD
MPVDNEEHKEILLGNKQLLSIFFIVVVLLGVAFTIGYTIGKNTATVHASAPAMERPGVAMESPTSNPTTPVDTAPTPAGVPKDPGQPVVTPKAAPVTHPAKPYVAEAPAATTTPDPESAQNAAAAPEAASAIAGSGTYLQVAALKREDADRIAKMLRTRGYPATLGDSSKEGLYRVLVGPFKNMADLSESKQKLKASGMDSFVVR